MQRVEVGVGNYDLFLETVEGLVRFFFGSVLSGLDTASTSVKGCRL